jgi:hypothetical protein
VRRLVPLLFCWVQLFGLASAVLSDTC